MKKLIYISGPISGLKLSTAKARFKRAERELNKEGFEVINPLDLDHMDEEREMQWGDYLIRDLHVLNKQRPEMYMLKGYKDSSGSLLEILFAQKLGLKIHYQ
jgi:hypothetical protein